MTEAGWWEAMNRISNVYLMVITTSFSIYYLPRLSEIKEISELRYEIFKCYKVIIPILLSGLTLVYLLRHFVVMILFSPDFYPMESLFIWQLLGDFFKISSWLLAFLIRGIRIFVYESKWSGWDNTSIFCELCNIYGLHGCHI